MKKGLKILRNIVIGIVSFVLVLYVAILCYFKLPVAGYYLNSKKGFVIPGCNDDFIAQGLSLDEKGENFFVTGYMKDHSASPIYVVSQKTKKLVKEVRLANEDGSAHTGHAGGLTVKGDYVYVAYGSGVMVYSYDKIINADNKASITAEGYFKTSVDGSDDAVKVSFTAIYNNQLFLGEFYRAGNYETADNHHLTTKSGEEHKAFAVTYNFSETGQYGLDPNPVALYSLPNQVQGMCFTEDKGYISISYGVAKSHIISYDLSKLAKQDNVDFYGKSMELYSFDSESLLKDTKIAPMSEEIVVLDGRLYTMCESASNKYIFGKLTGGKWCYATDINKL